MTDWYYLADRKRRGPLPLKALVDYVRSQPNPHEVPVSHKGLKSGWVPAVDVPEIASFLPPLPPGYKRPKYKSRVGLGLKDTTEDEIFFVILGLVAVGGWISQGLPAGLFTGILCAYVVVLVSRLFRRK